MPLHIILVTMVNQVQLHSVILFALDRTEPCNAFAEEEEE